LASTAAEPTLEPEVKRGADPSPLDSTPSWNASLLGALAGAGLALVATGSFLFVTRRRRQSDLVRGRVGVPISKQDLQVVFGKLDQVRRSEDEKLREQFHRLKAAASGGEQELARLHGRIDELKASVTGQQQKLDSYSDLMAAQNRKIEVLEEENRVLRALLQGPPEKR
jgi:peptidoglycan hydrolase CwlO-like protein